MRSKWAACGLHERRWKALWLSRNFYANASTGSNLNGGSSAGSATATDAAATYNRDTGAGGLDRITGSSGTPFASVAVGEFVGVVAAGGAAPITFLGRVTAVNASGASIDVSDAAAAGTRPADATSVDVKVGGAWLGPNGASGFPFAFFKNTLTDASGNPPRCNFKNGTNYAITAAMTHSLNGPMVFEGYTTTVGDGGKAIFDGTIVGASYVLLTLSSGQGAVQLIDLICQNNGTTGSANGLAVTGAENYVQGCVVHDVRGNGFVITGTGVLLRECEAYACNQSNTSAFAGFAVTSGSVWLVRCDSHDNVGSNSRGFQISSAVTLLNCVADTNGQYGCFLVDLGNAGIYNCDFYNNVNDGLRISTSSNFGYFYGLENCNFVKNGTGGTGYGINVTAANSGINVRNCGFGSGTQANTTGATNNINASDITGTVTYAANVTPWKDPANGDFSLNLPAALNAGRGTFTETQASYTGTVGYPPIGAAPPRIFRPLLHPGTGGGMRG